LLQVENRTRLGLNLVNVEVIDSCDLKAGLGALHGFPLLLAADFLGLLGLSDFVLNAEVKMAAMLLPELFKVVALSRVELKIVLLNFHGLFEQLVKEVLLQAKLTECKLSSLLLHSRVDKLELGVSFTNRFLDLLPVSFEIILGADLCLVRDNDWVLKIFVHKYGSAISVVLILKLGWCFVLRFLITLFLSTFSSFLPCGKCTVSSASDSISLNFDFLRSDTGLCDLLFCPSGLLDLVAVEEVADRDVAVLAGHDLFAEELVLAEVLIAHVVLNLSTNFFIFGLAYHYLL